MRIDSGNMDYIYVFDPEVCREEKLQILDDMCININSEERAHLNKLTTARQMDSFVVSMMNKYWG